MGAGFPANRPVPLGPVRKYTAVMEHSGLALANTPSKEYLHLGSPDVKGSVGRLARRPPRRLEAVLLLHSEQPLSCSLIAAMLPSGREGVQLNVVPLAF